MNRLTSHFQFPEPVTVAVSVKTADERPVAQKCAAGLFLWAAMLAFLLLRQQDPDSVGTEWPREEIRRGHFCFPGRFPAAGMRNSGRRADAAFRSPAGSRVAALGPAFCLSCAGARSAFRMDVQGGVARRVVAGHEARAHPFDPESRTGIRNSGREADAAFRSPAWPRVAARGPAFCLSRDGGAFGIPDGCAGRGGAPASSRGAGSARIRLVRNHERACVTQAEKRMPRSAPLHGRGWPLAGRRSA